MSAIYTFATRGDGSTAFIGYSNPSAAESPVRIVRLASGLQGYISDSRQQKAMSPLPPASRPGTSGNLRTLSTNCISGAAAGMETASGVEPVSGYRSEKIVMGNRTSWYALDYGCALVQEHFDWPDGKKVDKHLVLLRPGEPDASLFAVPAGYADVPESAFFAKP